ncbi:hypothetical protein ACHAPO_010242 [Fusarium lateritium]
MSWSSFKSFGGKLDVTFLQPHLNSKGQPDINASASSLYQWIQGLRESPIDYGIPSAKVHDVLSLLNHFFPKPEKGERLCPLRISSESGSKESLRRIAPLEIHLASGKPPILVGDAANALGYIFSVATPPGDSPPNFEDYLLPLAACYAWAVFLLFIWPHKAEAPVLTNVPNELSLIYLPSNSPGALTFCLGAMWSGANPANAMESGSIEDDEDEMDRWTRKQMVNPLFSASSLGLDSTWGPNIRRIAARRLNEYILGQKNYNSSQTPFLQPLFDAILSNIPGLPPGIAGLSEYILAISTLIKTELIQPLATAIDPHFLISHSMLSPKLMELLGVVIDEARVNADNPKLIKALQKLLEFYVTPHILEPVKGPELIPGPQTKPIVDTVAKGAIVLIPAVKGKLTSLFHHLNNTHESSDGDTRFIELSYFIPNSQSYTRSPELFPLYAL